LKPQFDRERESSSSDQNFRRLFVAAAVSNIGTPVSNIAIPIVAVSALHASSGQIGILGAMSTIAFLLIGLPAGVWVDRLRRRPVMIATDLMRAALLVSLPVALWLDRLSLIHLYAAVLLAGACTVFFDVASQSLLPQIVTRGQLTNANTGLVAMYGVSAIFGRSAGGLIIQILTAPAAIALDAVSFLWSALCIWRIRHFEPVTRNGNKVHIGQEIREGVRFVFSNPFLRAIAMNGALDNLAVTMNITLLPVLFVRELHLPAGMFGLYMAMGSLGVFIGARCASRIGHWIGEAREAWVLGLALTPVYFLLPLIDRGLWQWLAATAFLLTTLRAGVNNVILVSFRQRITPDHLLGRMTGTIRFLFYGATATGAMLAGLIGQLTSVRTVLWISAMGLTVSWLPIFFSPLRHVRSLHEAQIANIRYQPGTIRAPQLH
jgi:MFS family permease